MNKLGLLAASVAVLGFTAPGFASDNNLAQGRVQLAQAGVSVSIGERPVSRSRVVVREDRGRHRSWRHHNARADRVVIVKKKRLPPRRTVIIERR